MKGKEESEKAGLKLNIQKTKIMASGPITSWQTDGETMETGTEEPGGLPEFTQTHVHQVSDAIQPSHPLLSPSPPAPNPSQHQALLQ